MTPSQPSPVKALAGSCALAFVALLFTACAHNVPAASSRADSSDVDWVDLQMKDADLYDALRVLSMKARVSLFVDPDLNGRVTMTAPSIRWDEALAKIANDHHLRIERLTVPASERPCLWVSNLSSPPAPRTEFTGEPIAVSFDETPIRSAVKTLAESTRTEIAVDEDVDAAVTLHLRRIPSDLALYHLAQKYNLRIVRGGNGLRVSRP